MTKSFTALRLIAALFFSVLVSPAHAIWSSHAYSATATSMYEYNPSTGQQTFSGSSTFPGALVQTGDQFFGVFHYETDQIPAFSLPNGQGSQSVYLPTGGDNGAFSFSSSLGPLGYLLANESSPSSMNIIDNGDQIGDYLGLDFRNRPGEFLQAFSFFFNSNDAQAWSGTELPTILNLSDFTGGAYFAATWIRESDGVNFSVWGNIDSLMYLPPYVEPVPEPSAMLLFLAALMGMALVARKRAS